VLQVLRQHRTDHYSSHGCAKRAARWPYAAQPWFGYTRPSG